MGFREDLVAKLRAHAGIAALVGSGTAARIRPDRLRQRDPNPAIRYVFTNRDEARDLLGPVGPQTITVQIDCFGDTRSDAEALADAVRDCLYEVRGPQATCFVHGMRKTGDTDLEDPPDDNSDLGDPRQQLIYEFTIA